MADTYMVWVRCGNCAYIGSLKIAKGKLINEITCPKCGCKTIKKW